VKIQKAYKYKLELNTEQEKTLFDWLCALRYLYNSALNQRITNYDNFRKNTSYEDQANELKSVKESFPWISNVPHHCLQQKLKDLDSAYKRFFKGLGGFPKYQKRSGAMSMRFPDAKQFSVSTTKGKRKGFLKLPKIGIVNFVHSKSFDGAIKNLTISRNPSGEYFVSIQTEQDVLILSRRDWSTAVGIDRGVRTFGMTSEAEALEIPIESIKSLENKLAKEQRKLSRKKKGSRNFQKHKVRVAKLHQRLVNVRKDSLHKLSHSVAKSHSIVVLEDLKIKNMTKSSRGTVIEPGKNVRQKSGLNKSILRQGWYEFERQLTYKLLWSGGEAVKVNPHYTSQTCPKCSHVAKENRKNESFNCISCGHKSHADVVGAKNILERGHRLSVCGEAVPRVSKKLAFKKASVNQKPKQGASLASAV
jgi:putative transposase